MDIKNEIGSSESCSQLSDKRFNTISNLRNVENENKSILKHEMVRAELQSDYYDSKQNQFSSQCFKENDMARAELQWVDNLCLNTDFVSRPHFKNYELGNSEKNSNHVRSMPDEMAVHSENTKDKCPKLIPAFLKYQDSDSSVSSRKLSLHASWDSFSDVSSNNDIGIHIDNLHIKVSNHTDILETKNDQEEENKESSSGIRKDCPPISNSEDNRALKSHPQQPTVDAENKEYKNPEFVFMRNLMPDYGLLRSRISPFAGWPSDLDLTPQIMAEAGFFYIGINDYVRCFHCNGGLRNSDSGDNHRIKHAGWCPHCPDVLDKKNQAEPTQLAINNAGRSESSIRRHGTAFKVEFDSSQESGCPSGQQETTIEQELLPPDEGRPRSNSATSKEDLIKMR